MALTDTTSAAPLTLGKVLAAPFRAIGNGFVSLIENNSRIQQVDRLNALTDAQLAARGLKREDIVQHVFRDYMHL
ncbi:MULTISPECIES: DUF1127 domain-containing protein [unclassified Shimia]|uniref:DUF1127 domain-containing protein n=1 Tax=unclassified Shimia TaxID=2630038 RepID=UPI001ADA2990|nr:MULTISPECIES: DUF1127 domain-containing protein [unclassified Shimia]MBO9395769.1 DUF1127 domain-containing protein [Shimia sp. R9_2]MBO9399881.1 DUF1127 domain-containing protein [Shimia sp. R9_3]